MSAPDYFAAHASSEHEQLRLQGLELTWDPITHRRLLSAGFGEGQCALVVGAGRGSITRLLAELTGTRVVAANLDPRFLERSDPARLAFASQSLQLVAGNAIAAGSITAAERDAALELIADQHISVVSPTLFGAVAHRP